MHTLINFFNLNLFKLLMEGSYLPYLQQKYKLKKSLLSEMDSNLYKNQQTIIFFIFSYVHIHYVGFIIFF